MLAIASSKEAIEAINAMAIIQENRDIEVATPLGKDVLLLRHMTGFEGLGQLFKYELELVSEKLDITPEDIIGQNITVRLNLPNNKQRYFNGFVSRFVQIPSTDQKAAAYKATVVPWLWFLTRTSDCRIFQEKKVPEIIEAIIKDNGFTDFKNSLKGSYRQWEYCVQYCETDFDFLSRLMEQEGIYYFFEHQNGKHTMVLADSSSGHEPYEGYEEIKYRPFNAEENKEIIQEWFTETQLQPVSFALNAYDFENTQKDLMTRSKVNREHTAAIFERYEYPGGYVESKDGENYAKIRIEEIHSQYEVSSAATNARGISPGYTFQLKECSPADQNKEYLIVRAEYQMDSGQFESGESGGEFTYTCRFQAIDHKQVFRSRRSTPAPKIAGPQTAIVVGTSGEEIYTDKYGRVKVQFHWDRYGKADENSSCWIRVAQVWAGKKWGAIYTPRIGQEVIVEFLEGDPSRPIITGRVYNGTNMPPYDLPGEKTKSTIKTNSSKGGGGCNEICFEDKKDEEQLVIQAQKDSFHLVKNDLFETIDNDMHVVVKNEQFEHVHSHRNEFVDGNHLEEIGGDRNLSVKGKEAKEVSGNLSLTVGGNVTEDFKGNHNEDTANNYTLKATKVTIEASSKIELKVGGSSVTIEPAKIELKTGGASVSMNPGVIEVKAPKADLSGDAMVMIKGGIVKIN